LARHTGNALSRLIEAVRPNKKRHRVRAPLDAAHALRKRNGTAVEGDLGGFCVFKGFDFCLPTKVSKDDNGAP
jgi:hypothetical protein